MKEYVSNIEDKLNEEVDALKGFNSDCESRIETFKEQIAD